MTATGSPIPPGFFRKLFDTSFSEFITPTIIRVLYILILVMITIGALIVFIAGLARGGSGALVSLIVVPIGYLIYVILARVYMEILIVLFRIHESAAEIARNTRNRNTL